MNLFSIDLCPKHKSLNNRAGNWLVVENSKIGKEINLSYRTRLEGVDILWKRKKQKH